MAAAFMSFIVMTAAAVTSAASFLAAAAAILSVTATMAASGAMAVVREIFTVQALGQLLVGSLSYGNDLALEIQCLSGHLVIEVHHHDTIPEFLHDTPLNHSGGVEHRNHIPDEKHLPLYLSIDGERCLRQFHDQFRIIFPISLLRGQCEFKQIPGRLALQFALELGQQHFRPVYVVKRPFLPRPVHNLSVNLELIAQLDHLVGSYFHILFYSVTVFSDFQVNAQRSTARALATASMRNVICQPACWATPPMRILESMASPKR